MSSQINLVICFTMKIVSCVILLPFLDSHTALSLALPLPLPLPRPCPLPLRYPLPWLWRLPRLWPLPRLRPLPRPHPIFCSYSLSPGLWSLLWPPGQSVTSDFNVCSSQCVIFSCASTIVAVATPLIGSGEAERFESLFLDIFRFPFFFTVCCTVFAYWCVTAWYMLFFLFLYFLFRSSVLTCISSRR